MERNVEIAEHLWIVLEAMARDMGTDPQSLVNQAVFNWARRNGYPVMSMALAAVDTPMVTAPPAPAKTVATWDEPTKDHVSEVRIPVAAVPIPQPPISHAVVEASTPRAEAAKPNALADESTRAIDPDSPAAMAMRPRDPIDDVAAARNAVAARIVAIDRALDEVLPAAGRMNRPRVSATDTSPTPMPRFVLELRIDGSNDTVIMDDGPVIIGRARHCNLIVESPQVSREHAVITKVGASFILEDKGSANGTFVGDQQIQRYELRDGDVCHIGTAVVLVAIRASA